METKKFYMIKVIIRVATNSDSSNLLEELEIDNPESRIVEMTILKSAIKMYCEAEDGGTDLWMIGDDVSTPLEIPIRDFDRKMKA